jgi:hypothetical protein
MCREHEDKKKDEERNYKSIREEVKGKEGKVVN